MRNLGLLFITVLLMVLSLKSVALPVRHYFVGHVDSSSFGYEGKAVGGWYQYDFDTYDPNEPALLNLFSYSLKVGDLEIVEAATAAVTANIGFLNGAIQGFGVAGETPTDLNSGNSFSMDVFELGFTDGVSVGSPVNFMPTPENFNLEHMQTGYFEIFGHAPAVLPNEYYDVFWLKGSLQQINNSHRVSEPSTLILFATTLMLLLGVQRRRRS